MCMFILGCRMNASFRYKFISSISWHELYYNITCIVQIVENLGMVIKFPNKRKNLTYPPLFLSSSVQIKPSFRVQKIGYSVRWFGLFIALNVCPLA